MADLCKIYPKHQQQTAKPTKYYNILMSVNTFYGETFILMRLGSFFNVHPKQILFIVLIHTANRHILRIREIIKNLRREVGL